MNTDYQPAKRLHDAIITRQRSEIALAARIEGLEISQPAPELSSLDKQITLKAKGAAMQTQPTRGYWGGARHARGQIEIGWRRQGREEIV